jgi:hypothetical protein
VSLNIRAAAASLLRDSIRVSIDLCKIMVPLIILAKILKECGLIEPLAAPLGPVMVALGLPASLGLVWVTAMLSNFYAGLIMFQVMLPTLEPLTQAQVTVLAMLVLEAHNLFVECRVAKECGASFWGQWWFRVACGLVCAWLLHLGLDTFGLLQGPVRVIWTPPAQDPSLWAWALGEAKNLGAIFLIIPTLMGLMRTLEALGLIRVLERVMAPFLGFMGIGPQAGTITVIGMTMGLAYGGGLIIHETKAGRVSRADVLASVTLMGICHSLIEDTLLLALIGASAWGTLAWRLAFSLGAMALMVRVFRRGR